MYIFGWWQDCSSLLLWEFFFFLSLLYLSGSKKHSLPPFLKIYFFPFRYNLHTKRRMLHFGFMQADAQQARRRLLLHEQGKQQVLFRWFWPTRPVSPFFFNSFFSKLIN